MFGNLKDFAQLTQAMGKMKDVQAKAAEAREQLATDLEAFRTNARSGSAEATCDGRMRVVGLTIEDGTDAATAAADALAAIETAQENAAAEATRRTRETMESAAREAGLPEGLLDRLPA
jgi:DNA-binding protein YbaB